MAGKWIFTRDPFVSTGWGDDDLSHICDVRWRKRPEWRRGRSVLKQVKVCLLILRREGNEGIEEMVRAKRRTIVRGQEVSRIRLYGCQWDSDEEYMSYLCEDAYLNVDVGSPQLKWTFLSMDMLLPWFASGCFLQRIEALSICPNAFVEVPVTWLLLTLCYGIFIHSNFFGWRCSCYWWWNVKKRWGNWLVNCLSGTTS